MITIEHNQRRYRDDFSTFFIAESAIKVSKRVKLIKLTLSAFLLLFITGCTTSKLVIAPLYNRLDDQMRGEFHKLAKWDKAQIAQFEARVGTFHVWHRQTELPKYAALLNRIQSSIKDRDSTSKADINNWIDTAESYSQVVRTCHPVNFSFNLMQSLTDEQVNFIERRFASERKKNFTKYSSRTLEERRVRRADNVVKWAGRIGFDFNKTQRRMLDETFAKQISMRPQYYKLVDKWAQDLFVIARSQQAPEYEQKMKTQVNTLWTLLEKAHNVQWQSNRELWRGFGYDFVQSMSHDQRIHASNWIKKMGKTITGISKDKPSFKVQNNPELGCLVGQPING